jgi:hypothetical protein
MGHASRIILVSIKAAKTAISMGWMVVGIQFGRRSQDSGLRTQCEDYSIVRRNPEYFQVTEGDVFFPESTKRIYILVVAQNILGLFM